MSIILINYIITNKDGDGDFGTFNITCSHKMVSRSIRDITHIHTERVIFIRNAHFSLFTHQNGLQRESATSLLYSLQFYKFSMIVDRACVCYSQETLLITMFLNCTNHNRGITRK
jgi:hypothetical protein